MSSSVGYAISDFGSKRRSQPRLLDPNVIRLGELDKSAETPPLLGVVVVMDVGEAVIEKGIGEPFNDGVPISLGLASHSDPGKYREHLFVIEIVELGADRNVRQRFADGKRRRAAASRPDLGQIGVAEIENEELQPLDRA